MRDINLIVVHCTATREGQDVSVDQIREMHKARGFSDIGYHYIVLLNGAIAAGRDYTKVGAHVKGHNRNSIGISYVGGVAKDGFTPKDTRTPEQKVGIKKLIQDMINEFPGSRVCGHRDLSPDKDGDGIISPWEYMKACPSFDVKKEYPEFFSL